MSSIVSGLDRAKRRIKYSRSTGGFSLRRWTDKKAMKATMHRLDQVDGLLIEIAGIWSEEDEYICGLMDAVRAHVAEARKDIVEGHAELVEQRRLDREASQ